MNFISYKKEGKCNMSNLIKHSECASQHTSKKKILTGALADASKFALAFSKTLVLNVEIKDFCELFH